MDPASAEERSQIRELPLREIHDGTLYAMPVSRPHGYYEEEPENAAEFYANRWHWHTSSTVPASNGSSKLKETPCVRLDLAFAVFLNRNGSRLFGFSEYTQ